MASDSTIHRSLGYWEFCQGADNILKPGQGPGLADRVNPLSRQDRREVLLLTGIRMHDDKAPVTSHLVQLRNYY